MPIPASGVERSRDVGGWALLVLWGEADAAVVPALRAAVDALVAQHRAHMVWDLQDVTFMDSAGLGCLVYAMRLAEARQGVVRLAGAVPQVLRLLDLTGLGTVVEVFPDVRSAVATARG
ncbi:STAS domain-containing protein [Streptomyces tremellae]|uniref:Anti-sigma factor antagonist n=1 Tax=Streptomyces tremellae TaxID=1124239 RepID=A0ABP7EWB1_9ACTN